MPIAPKYGVFKVNLRKSVNITAEFFPQPKFLLLLYHQQKYKHLECAFFHF